MGLLDWLTDGSLGNMGMGAGGANPPAPSMPPVQQTGADGPPLPLTPAAVPPGLDAAPTPSGQPPAPVAPPAPPPDPTPAAGPPDPPVNPATSDIGGGMQGGGPTPPPVPMPQPRPPGADAPPPAPPASPGPPMPLTPSSLPPPGNGTNGVGPGLGVAAPPYQLGDQTALGRALGINPQSKQFSELTGGLGAGLTAAGNSKGKSPFQALTSGAGASLEGANKEGHATEKDMNAYLTAATNAQKAGDTKAAQMWTQQYQAAKLKNEQDKAASDKSAANKNDTDNQKYWAAQRDVQPDRTALNKQIAQMQKDGAPPDQVAKAQAAGEAAINARLADHYAASGIHPQTAAQIAQQPGNSEKNPVATGLTPSNITKKLQPGQYYSNPAEIDPATGKPRIYQFKGDPSSKSSSATSSTKKDDDDADTPAADPKKKAADEDDD